MWPAYFNPSLKRRPADFDPSSDPDHVTAYYHWRIDTKSPGESHAAEFSPPGQISPGSSSHEPPDGRIAHTLTACTRCRQRKSRCDPGLPRCVPCERSNAKCVYYDSTRNTTIPRTYIVSLRERARALEKQLAAAEKDVKHSADAGLMVRSAGRIRFHENDEPRYLGPSSGIAMTRLVMEMAKQNTDSKSIKDVVPELTAQEIKAAFAKEDSKPTSKVYPMISSLPQPNLPPVNLTNKLIDVFMVKAQAMLPILHEPSFRREAKEVFDGSTDPCHNFQLRMAIAVSMQKMSPEYAGLADSYYLAALPYLDPVLKNMDLRALQCLVMIAQYSMLTPTRTAAYWVVGTAVKLCQDLGLTEEATITKPSNGQALNALEVDMRRRLFWAVTSMEFGLSHSLGRASCYSVTHDNIDVKFFELVDDRYITAKGVTPGAKPVLSKCISVHFFKMRLFQLEARRKLYLNPSDTPVDDQDPWFHQMMDKIDRWLDSCPKHDDGSGMNVKWFEGRRNTIVILMYRPSPQIPEPSVNAAKICFEASTYNIVMHKEQMVTGSVDLTWIFTQALFMALNTILWTLSYPEIRKEHPVEEVQTYLDMALEVIVYSAERWPGVMSAYLLYRRLVTACLKAYSTDESFVVHSPSSHPTPTSSQGVMTPPAMSRPSSTTTSSFYAQSYRTANPAMSSESASTGTISRGQSADPPFSFPASTPPAHVEDFKIPAGVSAPPFGVNQPPVNLNQSPINPNTRASGATGAYGNTGVIYPDISVDPNTPYNAIPSVVPGLQGWDPNFSLASTTASHLAYIDATVDPMHWTTTIEDQFSQYFHEPFPVPARRERTLSQQEQIELMASLEQDIPDVSAHACLVFALLLAFRAGAMGIGDTSLMGRLGPDSMVTWPARFASNLSIQTLWNHIFPLAIHHDPHPPPDRTHWHSRIRLIAWNAYGLDRALLSETIRNLCPVAEESSTLDHHPVESFLGRILMSDRAPSISFHAAPLSPSSPAAGSFKENHQLLIHSDHIPPDPDIASVDASPDQAITHPNTSPPSPTPMSTQVSQQPTLSMTNSFPAPASSVSGYPMNAPSSDEPEHKSFTSGTQDDSRKMEEDQKNPEQNGSEHEQQQSVVAPETGVRDFADQPSADNDAMDVDKESAPRLNIRNLGLDALNENFTSAFHICKSSPTVTGPDPSMDLISLYGLGSIAKSVARMDPITGEKINRLRKSYEGKLKGLGLAGRNKAVKQEPGAPGSLRHLTLWPEEEWQNQKVFGKQIKIADMDSGLQDLHAKAMQLEPGPVPNNDFWEDVLGHEKPTKAGASDSGKKPAAIPSRPALPGRSPAPTSQDAERGRPTRGRKRNYDDNSFVGYGEGYIDDEEDTGFLSGSEGSNKKKRKKEHMPTKVSTPLSERSGSYGVGMFGIGAR
ncbi:hypothetical protein N7468_010267 [Penicillium chermesinum]|uniref:Mediator of RNA polymerase II transcription subunit 19 n=1 Tax=Penicillium chermesinum TaxID=63820 RepID=A0A9W9NCG6_9EURO|nr:uncharacterized protein N7468_010267 [Penicillium chermesinum]KAJ5217259.1 hypothetical protein N7468_010267 [Penicillium chermesinum]